MPPLKWSDAFKTGHKPIDHEHRKILRWVDSIETFLETGKFAKANTRCRALRDLLERHFGKEERFLTDLSFPRLAEHAATHEAARTKIRNIIRTCCDDCRKGLDVGCTAAWREAILDDVMLADLDFKSHLQFKNVVPRD